MFDLIADNLERPLQAGTPRSTVLSVVLHVGIAAALIGVPLLRVTNTLPEVPTIMAFVSAPPPSPPPPAPPPAPTSAQDTRAVARNVVRPAAVSTAPVQAPSDVAPEPVTARPAGDKGGTEGGVEGGIPGGVVQGIAGGILGNAASVEAPPPAPLPPAPTEPVRLGGQIRTPELLHRVEPIYPDVAAAAQITGIVILEAVVDTSGCVESIKVLRGHALLSRAATNALTEWRYRPLTLNGVPTSFVLTVTFNFSARR